MKSVHIDHQIAKIENVFVEKSRYNLSTRQQKTLMYMIAKLDPIQEKDFFIQNISLKELEEILKDDKSKKWGGSYKEIVSFIKEMAGASFLISSDYYLDNRNIPGARPMFEKIDPVTNKKNEMAIQFRFSQHMKPFLLQLRQFVKIDRVEIGRLRRKHSIRLYTILKAEYQRRVKYTALVPKKIDVEELKEILSVEDKYTEFKAFNQFVLKPAKKEINENTSIKIDYKLIRVGRKVNTIDFTIMANNSDQLSLNLTASDKAQKKKLSPAALKAKREKFDFDMFKRRYKKIYLERAAFVKSYFGDTKPNPLAVERTIKNECQEWWVKNT